MQTLFDWHSTPWAFNFMAQLLVSKTWVGKFLILNMDQVRSWKNSGTDRGFRLSTCSTWSTAKRPRKLGHLLAFDLRVPESVAVGCFNFSLCQLLPIVSQCDVVVHWKFVPIMIELVETVFKPSSVNWCASDWFNMILAIGSWFVPWMIHGCEWWLKFMNWIQNITNSKWLHEQLTELQFWQLRDFAFNRKQQDPGYFKDLDVWILKTCKTEVEQQLGTAVWAEQHWGFMFCLCRLPRLVSAAALHCK